MRTSTTRSAVLELGAHGYLIKSAAVDELVEAISAVRDGRVYISQKVSDDVLQHLRRPKRKRVGTGIAVAT